MIADTLSKIHTAGLIAALRNLDETQLEPVLKALLDGGVHCVEITMNQPEQALRMIARAKTFAAGELLLGAGTVLDAATARLCIVAGAEFVLAPTLCPDTIQLCNRYDVLAVPGVFTATEALYATSLGAQLIKLFPATSVGPEYIKDLLGPLPHLRLLPMGGITADNATAYRKAGAYAVGVGSWLVSKISVTQRDFTSITMRASQLVEAWQAAAPEK